MYDMHKSLVWYSSTPVDLILVKEGRHHSIFLRPDLLILNHIDPIKKQKMA